ASVGNALRARHVLAVFQERPHGRVLLWRTDPEDVDGQTARPIQLPAARHADYWFDAPGAAWHASRLGRSRGSRFRAIVLDAQGRRSPPADITVPEGFLASHACRH